VTGKKTAPKKASPMSAYDIAIIGSGPSGLALAAALKNSGFRLCLIEKQSEAALAKPSFDGRDTALTHFSIRIMKDLGLFQRIPAKEISPIKQARVLDGTSPYALQFDSRDDDKDALGYLVSNHLIRKAAYELVKGQAGLALRTDVEVTGIETGEAHNRLRLSNGQLIEASLVVAADSRFSNTRRMMGIPLAMRDFGRTVVVCRVKHTEPHHQIAHECFHYGRTLAVLPLQGNTSSIVITLPSDQVEALMHMPAKAFAAEVAERFGDRLGTMTLITERHAYPLVATYADRFVGHRFALLGDAAVGMHPVTAHGYNFGLYGVQTLVEQITKSRSLGLDIADPLGLARFNRRHRKATLPLYLGTNALVALYTNEKPMVKHVRRTVLRLGNLMKPLNRMITQQLTQAKAFA
jgi:ubiquinone biosynthesis UbiH/UbiF/VisC/COQ6 family hydroxylase